MLKPRVYGSLGILALTLSAGCSRDDTDRLARIGAIIGARVEVLVGDASDDFTRRLQQARERRGQLAQKVQNDLAQQIASRLKTDSALAGCQIQLAITGDHVEVRGTVKDMQQHRRVLELVESTPGVADVKDSLRTAQK